MQLDIYGLPQCDECERVCNYLDELGVIYNYYNISVMEQEDLMYVINELAPGANKAPIILIEGRNVTFNGLTEYFKAKERFAGGLGERRVYQEGWDSEEDEMHDESRLYSKQRSSKT